MAIDIFDCFDKLETLAKARDWTKLDGAFRPVAAELAGAAIADQIAALDFTDYGQRLQSQLRAAEGEATTRGAEAVLFRYDLDAQWTGRFFCCPNYEPFAGDEEWWAAEEEQVGAPVAFAEAGAIYASRRHAGDDADAAVMLYLVARTVAALGGISSGKARKTHALCAAYTGQEPFTRLREYIRSTSGEIPALNLPDPDLISHDDTGETSETGEIALGDLPDDLPG